MVKGMEKHDVQKRGEGREERTSKEDVEMRWGRGQQRGSSGNCYGDDVSGNWKVVSFVAFVCEMGAIPARRNRHTYIYRLIVVYVQLWRIHNHRASLECTQYPEGVAYLHTVFVLQTLNLETSEASFRDFGSFDMSGE